MTTIAIKDGVMACDSKCTGDYYEFLTKTKKIYRLSNGALLGTAGDADARDLIEILGKCTCKKLPSRAALAEIKRETKCILAFPNGKVFMVWTYGQDVGSMDSEWSGSIVEIEERFCAVGSGEQFAIGAMAAGRTAAEAVHIACRFDSMTQAPVKEVPVKEPKRAKRAT